MKYYLIEYTFGDKWELSKGILIISANSKREAIKLAEKQIGSPKVEKVVLISSKKEKVIYNQDPAIH